MYIVSVYVKNSTKLAHHAKLLPFSFVQYVVLFFFVVQSKSTQEDLVTKYSPAKSALAFNFALNIARLTGKRKLR